MSGLRKGRLRELADLLDRLDQSDPVETSRGLRIDGFYAWDPWYRSRHGLVTAANGRTLADLPALVCARWAPGEEADLALAAKLLGLSEGALVPLVNPGNSYWCQGRDLTAARVASACRYVASLTDADVRRRSRDDADAWRRLVWDQGYGRGLVRLSKLKRADLDAHGIGLSLAFLKWIASPGHWEHTEERELFAPEWGYATVKFYDLDALAAAVEKDPDRFEVLRAEYAECRRRKAEEAAARPGSGPVMSGRYYANDKWIPFEWGALVDGWIHLAGGIRRKESGRTVIAWPVLQDGKPTFAPIPPKPKPVEAPFTGSDPVYGIWYREGKHGIFALGGICSKGHPRYLPHQPFGETYYWRPATGRAYVLADEALARGEKDAAGVPAVYGLTMTESEAIAFWSALQDAAAQNTDIWIPPGTEQQLRMLQQGGQAE